MEIHPLVMFADIGRSVPSLILDSGLFAKSILLVLATASVISWAIIYDRTRLYLKLARGGRKLQGELFAKGLAVPTETVSRCLPSIEGALYLEARRYVERLDGGPSSKDLGAGGGPPEPSEDIRSILDRRAISEISEMEKYLIFLATTAGVSPFLGLLGTVWGIMSSFLSMGIQGSASIEVVGPGIAEALITTIAGLGAAIPALVGYNLLVRHVRHQEARLDMFISKVSEIARARISRRPPVRSEASYEKRSL